MLRLSAPGSTACSRERGPSSPSVIAGRAQVPNLLGVFECRPDRGKVPLPPDHLAAERRRDTDHAEGGAEGRDKIAAQRQLPLDLGQLRCQELLRVEEAVADAIRPLGREQRRDDRLRRRCSFGPVYPIRKPGRSSFSSRHSRSRNARLRITLSATACAAPNAIVPNFDPSFAGLWRCPPAASPGRQPATLLGVPHLHLYRGVHQQPLLDIRSAICSGVSR